MSYLRFGKGSEVVIAWHGYGEAAQSFQRLGQALEKEVSLYAIDFPMHGNTQWQSNTFDLDDAIGILQQLLSKEAIATFSLIGYSFGGRVAQAIFSHFTSQLNQLILIAPDGLDHHHLAFWLSLPVNMRRLVTKKLIQSNFLEQQLQSIATKKMLPPAVNYFIKHELSTKAHQLRAFFYWTNIIHFQQPHKVIVEQFTNSEIPIHLFLGERDQIIPSDVGKKWQEKVPTLSLHFIDVGHRMLGHQTLIDDLKQILCN